ncbi:MAG TPA: hypothetical protein PLK31_26280, partial [Chloroflexota bacterium]|nr:hypothetical protein [Chloroflexota bacterium]
MDLIFLHGGGDKAESRQDTFGRFVAAANAAANGPIALVIAEANEDDARESWRAYSAIFTALGVLPEQLRPFYTSATTPLTYDMLANAAPSGLFVCGGVTPYYHQALCADATWVDYLRAAHIPYGGTSAGAAVAAQQAILGGWQAERQGQPREILFVGAGEGLNPLTVRPGLG